MKKTTSNITIYKASAGSGKTYALTKEYIRLLLHASSHNFKNILAVTFTNKACGEMKERILETLFALSNNISSVVYAQDLCDEFSFTHEQLELEAKRILHEILHNYSFFYVETIDTFFQRIIRNFAKELGLHSYYGLQLDVETVIQNSIQELFLHIYEYPQIQQWLIEYTNSKIDEAKERDVFKSLVKDSKILLSESFMQIHDSHVAFDEISTFFKKLEQIISEFENEAQVVAKQIVTIVTKHGLQSVDFKGGSRSCMNPIYAIAEGKEFDYEVAKFQKLLNHDEWFAKTSPVKNVQSVLENTQMPQLLQTIFDVYAGPNAIKYRTAQLLLTNKYLVGMLQAIQQSVDLYCKEQELFLISNTNKFLQTIIGDSDAPFVYEKIGCFIKHMMIDEFQDTSKMQWHNFFPLINNALAEGGSALVVGDVKQSIYRFRNGDWKLLHNTIYKDFSHDVHTVSLQHNWRSRKNIIQFNNVFFKVFSKTIEASFHKKIHDDGIDTIPDDMVSVIQDLYSDVTQEISNRTKDGGFVQIQIVEKDSYLELVLQQLIKDVVYVLEQGYAPEDIVFLCREKKHISLLVSYFNEQKQVYPQYTEAFSIVTGEGLLLSGSDAVQFILAYLQWLENPAVVFNKKLMSIIFARLYSTNSLCDISNSNDFESQLQSLSHISKDMSLLQIIEAVIHGFTLYTISHELVYIVEFQNIVYSYCKNNSVSISQFIEWWYEQEDSLYIKQEPKGYMRAMTIHKSKGLQFSVVFMPFVNWKLFGKPLLVCDTKNTDFTDMPYAIVPYNNAMAKTQFSQQYLIETLQSYIDNLNIVYVACTRAVDALYMYIPNQADSDRISNYIGVNCKELQEQFPEGNHTETLFSLGELPPKTKIIVKENAEQNSYPVYIRKLAILPMPESLRFVDRINVRRKEQIHGLRMHRMFEYIITLQDIETAVQQALYEKIIDKTEVSLYEDYCTNAILQSNVQRWFNPQYTIVTEQSILTPQGEKRPDRIVFTSDRDVEVIDYKFTAEQNPKHIVQVAEYVSVLESMGYSVQGFVWYVLQNNVVLVGK
mgnify:CR=1 FL=1|jgi:ATP-dependent exoDNAse (exonuclease V) beta subunit